MNFRAITDNYSEAQVQAIVAPIFKDEKADSGVLKELDELSGGNISAMLQSEEFKGKEGETLYLPISGNAKAKRILLVGIGDQGEYKAPGIAVLAGSAARFLRGKSIKSFVLITRSSDDVVNTAAAAAQGVITSLFELDKYRTADKEERKIDEVVIISDGASQADLDKGLERGKAIGESMNFTRDLANEPANVLTPTEMANRAKAMAAEVGLKCEILDEAQMESLGMGSLLSVSLGSEQPAKLIVLRYEPASSTANGNEMLGLVGKGITFDTGGISLKPAEGMDAMKYDMSGGATVIGAMRAIGLLKPSVPVLGVVAAVENMPDGKATRPGDVVTAMNGKTVEILNTDAEGRLILADAVAYAEKEGATTIIDMATLTGAVVIALGDVYTGLLGTSQELMDDIVACSKEVGEKFWQLPVGKEYSAQIKSDIADVKNIGKGRKAGTIAGAVFIQEFIKDAKWAHLDIAGTAWNDEPKAHYSKGPSGVAIRTLLRLVEKSQ
jgi:leucyl aminopeptidase